jgi:hypothetical protein
MMLPDLTRLEQRLRAAPFDRGERKTWAADVWLSKTGQNDPEPRPAA